MKTKILMTVLLIAFVNISSFAGFEQFEGPVGEVNTFNNSNGSQGNWLWWSSWGVPDLQAITTDDRTFELLPNISTYSGAVGSGDEYEINYWTDSIDLGVTPGDDGNKFLEANTIFQIGSLTNGESSAIFNFDVDAFDLNSRYYLEGFLKVLDSGNDYVEVTGDRVVITEEGSHALSISIDSGMYGMVLQAGWVLKGLNANPATNWGSATVTATALAADVGDIEAPAPDPMTFAVAPYAFSDQEIRMTATTATDASAVEYYFTCTAGDGHDSGWQSSTNYVDTGLVPGSSYTYTVSARDQSINLNETAASAPVVVQTLPADTEPPSPDPMVFASAPLASTVSISMEAETATDDSLIEYYFTCTSGAGNDSGWQRSSTYVDTGLVPNSNYSYTVSARDLSAATNQTAASTEVMAMTTTSAQWMVNSLMSYNGDSEQVSTAFEVELDSLELSADSAVAVVVYDEFGATFGEGTDYKGRNILRTVDRNYGDSSFEAYATFVFDGASDQAAFIGMGQGVVDADVPGNYGVPELAIAGVNGIVGEIKTVQSAGDPKGCNLLKIIDGESSTNNYTGPVATNDTFRVKLSYDAGAETATVSIDTNYTGGVFTADRVLGTLDTSVSPAESMWEGVPVRVYVGGGEGTVVSDLIIRAFPSDIIVDDLSAISPAAGKIELSWEGSAGQLFEVLYRTDLVFGSWLPHPTFNNIYDTSGGSISATTTVNGVTEFYKVIAK